MNRERRSGFPLVEFLMRLALVLIFVFLLIWLFPMPNLDPVLDEVFRDNLTSMRDSAQSYYTNERMPKNVGDSAEMSLQEMLDESLVLPFVDKNGKECDTKNSYVKVTKTDTEYEMKVNLKCGAQENYIIVHQGCYNKCPDPKVNCSCNCGGNGNSCGKKQTYQEEQYQTSYATKTILQYQHAKTITTKKKAGKTCSAGKILIGGKCCKTTSQTSRKSAHKAYTKARTKVINAAKHQDADKKQEIDATVTDVSDGQSCPSGYTLSNGKCTKTVAATLNTKTTYTCPSGYTKSGSGSSTKCKYTKKATAKKTTTYKACSSGWTASGKKCKKKTSTKKQSYTYKGTCYKTTTSSSTAWYKTAKSGCRLVSTMYCSNCGYCGGCNGHKIYKYTCSVKKTTSYSCNKKGTKTVAYCPSGSKSGNYCYKTRGTTTKTTYSCPSGYTKSGSGSSTKCTITKKATVNKANSYSCSTGTLSGKSCIVTTTATDKSHKVYSCPSGYTLDGTNCYKIISGDVSYSCPSGYTQHGTKCYKHIGSKFSHYYCDNGWSLSGSTCYKTSTAKNCTAAKQTYKTATSKRYIWSTRKSIPGWERTGKTRTITKKVAQTLPAVK